MGWTSVALVKNDLNEYRFAVIPNIAAYYSGPPQSGDTVIQIGGYRNSYYPPYSQLFETGLSYAQAIAAQQSEGIFNLWTDHQSYSKFIYGTLAGEALKLEINVTESGAYYPFNVYPKKYYNNMQSYIQILTLGSSMFRDASLFQYNTITWALLINHDTEECYLAFVISSLQWKNAVGTNDYYDRAECNIYVSDQGGKNSMANLYSMFKDSIPSGSGSNPYVTDDYDEPVGGNDDPDDTSDTILEDALPTIGATISGLCTAYVPTITQMQALANRLVDPTWYQALGNTVLNISDAVIGLQVLPFVVPSTLSQNQWKLNFLGISLASGVYLNKANQQFCEIPCGTIHVTPYWNNCLDYNPYTQISVFLPFCGFFELDTDDVMDHDLEIKYRVDIMSGACLATIKVDGSVMYQFAGECGNQIPVSSVSFDNFLQSAMQLAITTASGSIGLAAAGASATMQKEKIAMSDMSAGDKQIAEDAVNTELKFKKSQNGVGLLAATAGAVISAKGQYKHAGCIAGSPGFLGVRKPYLIIKRPKQIMPSLYGDFRGYPTNTVMKLSDCHGYTEVDSIRLNIPNATVDEIYECETLLKEGVVFD